MKTIKGYQGETIKITGPDSDGYICIQIYEMCEDSEELACVYVREEEFLRMFAKPPSEKTPDVEDLLLAALAERGGGYSLELHKDGEVYVAGITLNDTTREGFGRSQDRATAVRLAAKNWADKQVQPAALAALQAVL